MQYWIDKHIPLTRIHEQQQRHGPSTLIELERHGLSTRDATDFTVFALRGFTHPNGAPTLTHSQRLRLAVKDEWPTTQKGYTTP